MADNPAYVHFQDTNTAPPTHGYTTFPNATDQGKEQKKWKNSRRLCWVLLVISLVTLILEIIGTSIAGVHLDWLLARFAAGIWLAALGVISSAIGLRAFRNSYEHSQCWTYAHFVMCIIATVAYGALMLMAAWDVNEARLSLEEYYEILMSDYDEYEMETTEMPPVVQNYTQLVETTTIQANATTTIPPIIYENTAMLNSIRADMAISVFLLGTTIAFLITGIIANVVMCRHWCGRKQKSMTIVYMPNDQSGNPQTQSVVLPAKGQVIMVQGPKPSN